MKWVVRFAGLLATIIGSVVVIGWLLPQNHVTARSVEYRAPMDTVWKLITDIASMPGWRTDLARVEILPPLGQQFAWRETSGGGDVLTFVRAEARPSTFLRTTILDEGGPFGGEWVHDLRQDEKGGMTLTITERGWVRNPLFRFVSQIVIGHNATIDAYLSALGDRLGETATIQDAVPAEADSGMPPAP
ncbi:MAG: SRPBCC family protein [Gemmatimonadaceae bacterium]|nr:SRPBCC family protein [Gemmatimonadaceae bacterium]